MINALVTHHFKKEKNLLIKPKDNAKRKYGLYIRYNCCSYFKYQSKERKLSTCKKIYTAKYVSKRNNIIVTASLEECNCLNQLI